MFIHSIYIFLATVLAIGITGWFYYSNRKSSRTIPKLLFGLRFISVFAIILLLFNPVWKRNAIRIEKPKLIVGIDNSLSIQRLGQTQTTKNIVADIQGNKPLHEKFEIEYLAFGHTLKTIDSLQFKDTETDIHQLLHYAKPLKSKASHDVILLTDGNATKGNDISFYKGQNTIYPIVLGDTTRFADVYISQINVNGYTFLDNTFPVELFAHYQGNQSAQTTFTVYENQNKVFQQSLTFHTDKNVEHITFTLPAKSVGTHYYRAELSALPNEKNKKNNQSDFTIEVVNQQAKILIASSVTHPDLGALKQSIELNKQRTAEIKVGNFNTLKLADYQSVILYQPNAEFSGLFAQLNSLQKNYSIITGTKTDWNFLNSIQKDFTKSNPKLNEQYRGVYNKNFPHFTLDDFGVSELPPLQDIFGEIRFTVPYETLFYAQVGNTTLENPLLATYVKNEKNYMVLFGEGLWQWRLWSHKEKQSYEPFSQFINALVQFTSKSENRNQIQIDYQKLLYHNQPQRIKAQFFDQNYKIDNRVTLTLQLTDLKTKKTTKLPFAQLGEFFQVEVNHLPSGNYSFTVIADGKNSQTNGFFKVLDYNTEEQFVSANYTKLNQLAQNSNGKIVLAQHYKQTIDNLRQKETQNIQKTIPKNTPLLHWKWLLLIIIVSLSVEWFIRKYRGLL